ncbi:MAG TPA: hypothetical protein ENN67_05050 [Firmicutes bacterium]|nr:hypothetical protein [Bacillota bacterium]
MGAWLIIVFVLLGLLSVWMTASAIIAFTGQRQREDEMLNLYEQVAGAVRNGDLPRAILLLEGEPGPLAILLSSILTEATKFTPKLRVAYKITLESLKRRSMMNVSSLRAISIIAIFLGILGIVSPIVALIENDTPAWRHSIFVLIVAVVIAAISQITMVIAIRQDREMLLSAGELGRKLLGVLMKPSGQRSESPELDDLYDG